MNWLHRLFASLSIDAFGTLAIEDAQIINARLLEKEGFAPRSVLMFLVPYYAGETVNLSRYAAARDYHIAIREITARLIEGIKREYPQAKAKGYGDHSPIAERTAALHAGLGILGDNGLLLHEKYGSYVFIGDIITDLPPECLFAAPPQPIRHCEHCGRCKRACPTGILRGEGEDCLSAITQRKGELSESEKALMRKYNTAWGCDICQSVCPHNASPAITPVPFFKESLIPHLTAEVLSSMDADAFSERAFAWRGRKTVERNLDILDSHSKNEEE